MATDDHWITIRITEAQIGRPLVTERVSSRMAELLKGQLSGQQLSQGELTSLARALIADMVPTPPEAEAKQ